MYGGLGSNAWINDSPVTAPRIGSTFDVPEGQVVECQVATQAPWPLVTVDAWLMLKIWEG